MNSKNISTDLDFILNPHVIYMRLSGPGLSLVLASKAAEPLSFHFHVLFRQAFGHTGVLLQGFCRHFSLNESKLSIFETLLVFFDEKPTLQNFWQLFHVII